MRKLGDAVLDGKVIRVVCDSCGHSAALLPGALPGFPDEDFEKWRAKLWCSKCEGHAISASEVLWCPEMKAWPPSKAMLEYQRLIQRESEAKDETDRLDAAHGRDADDRAGIEDPRGHTERGGDAG